MTAEALAQARRLGGTDRLAAAAGAWGGVTPAG